VSKEHYATSELEQDNNITISDDNSVYKLYGVRVQRLVCFDDLLKTLQSSVLKNFTSVDTGINYYINFLIEQNENDAYKFLDIGPKTNNNNNIATNNNQSEQH